MTQCFFEFRCFICCGQRTKASKGQLQAQRTLQKFTSKVFWNLEGIMYIRRVFELMNHFGIIFILNELRMKFNLDEPKYKCNPEGTNSV